MKSIATPFRLIFFSLFILTCFFLSLIQIENYDIWWHLKTGQWITSNLTVPRTQLFSFAIGDIPWVSHSWFFQTLIFLIYKFLGGIDSLILFRAVIVALIFWVTLKGFLNKVYLPVFLLTAWLFSGLFLARIPIRPELMSAIFLALCLYTLFNKKNLWLLVFMQFFWVNMHGYSMLGPILLFLFILSELIKRKIRLPFEWNKVRYFNDRAAYNKSIVVLIIIILLFLVNPYGLDNLKYPFFAFKSFLHSVDNFYHVSELSSSRISDTLFTQKDLLLTGALFLFMISLLLNIRTINLFNILVYIIFFIMYCAAERHRGFFAVASCFCMLDNFRTDNLYYLRRYFRFKYTGILSMILSALLGSYIIYYQFTKVLELRKPYVYSEDFSSKDRMFETNGNKYPKKAVDFMVKSNIKGPIFNSFNIGGYLIWRLYPEHKVFIDGRTEVYGKKFMDEFARSLIDFEIWEKLDEKYGFNAVILDYSASDVYYHLIKNLYESQGWKLVYFGDVALIFVKDGLANKDIISSHNILFENMQKGDKEKEYPVRYRKAPAYPAYFLNRARFFIKAVDMPGLGLKYLEEAGSIDPECYEVYQLIGYAFFKMKKFKEAENAFMKSLQIDPNIAEPYVNLGSVAAQMGLYEKARLLYKRALLLDKSNKAAIDNLNRLP